MHENLIPRNSVLLLYLESSQQKVDRIFREVSSLDLEGVILDVLNQVELSEAIPGSLSVKQFIEYYAQGPDVALRRVVQTLEDLNGHVERSPH